MFKKLGELKIDNSADYFNRVVKSLEKAGYILVRESSSFTTSNYIVARADDEDVPTSDPIIDEDI